ncbi:alkaline ceramidase 3-like [Dysidea avara]|uniref:alkaline ceramidase 3-like n=1 Tax=Dysidea avara TaxID=196820 RepID=UPI00331F5A9C
MPAFAPPENQPIVGHWGKPTSTLDFCEENYAVNFYIAEFWNTITNISTIILPLVGAITSWRGGLERRYIASYVLLTVVGIGSLLFHGSLLYQMQLLDELPMLFTAVQLLYCLLNMGGPHGKQSLFTTIYLSVLYLLTAIISIAYVVVGNPVFHQVAFGMIMLAISFEALYVLKAYVHWRYLSWTCVAFGSYIVAFLIWLLDNNYCSDLRNMRADLGHQHPISVFSQLHGWWHLLTGNTSFLHILISSRVRMTYLGYNTKIKTICGIPYLQVSKEHNL